MKWRRWRVWGLVAFAVGLLSFAAVSWWVGGRLVAPAQRSVAPVEGMEAFRLASESGVELAGWWRSREGATATVILLHHVRGDRRAMLSRAELLRAAGYGTVMIDLQAHGESEGEQITLGYRERLDVAAVVAEVRRREPAHRIGIVGCSLGGVATVLASPLGVDAVVLEAVYPTVTEAVHNRIGMRLGWLRHLLAPALLVQLKPRLGIWPSALRPIDRIAELGCPVLVASGDRDRHTTLAQTKRLYEAAQEPKQLLVFEGAAHEDLLAHDPGTYQEIVRFFDTHLGPRRTPVGGGSAE